MITSSQHQLLLDDAIGQEKIKFNTANALNALIMDATVDNQTLTLTTQQGLMTWQSQQAMQVQSDDSAHEMIGNNKIQAITQNYQLTTQTQDLQQQAATDHQFIAQQNSLQQAYNNLEIANQGNLLMAAQQAIILLPKVSMHYYNSIMVKCYYKVPKKLPSLAMVRVY